MQFSVKACLDKDIANIHFFQLELASLLKARNIEIVGLNDINFLFDKVRVIIQCIRPLSETNVEDDILNAYSHLNKKIKDNERGIIAIAVDKILQIDNKILECKNLNVVTREENIKIDEAIDKFSYVWKNFKNINIVGIFLLIKFKFKPWGGSIMLRKGLHIIPLNPNTTKNELLIKGINNEIQSATITNNFILPDFSAY